MAVFAAAAYNTVDTHGCDDGHILPVRAPNPFSSQCTLLFPPSRHLHDDLTHRILRTPTRDATSSTEKSVLCPICAAPIREEEDFEEHLADRVDDHLLALWQRVQKLEKDYETLWRSSSRHNPSSMTDSLSSFSSISSLPSGRWHPGRIGAAPNWISRRDASESIHWSSSVDENTGYTWDNFRIGWSHPLSQVYLPNGSDTCDWTCCGGEYDSAPCTQRPIGPL